jgi:hypothetical protein
MFILFKNIYQACGESYVAPKMAIGVQLLEW